MSYAAYTQDEVDEKVAHAYAEGRKDERQVVAAAIERAGFSLMETDTGHLFLLNVEDEPAAL